MPYRDTRRLPLLDNVRIASPCDAPWHTMPGDDRVRFCHRCGKHVYNLAAMTRKEAELLLAERQGPLCVSLFKRADGTVITSDCVVGVRQKQAQRARFAAVAAGAIAAAGATAVAARDGIWPASPLEEDAHWSADQDRLQPRLLGAVVEREKEPVEEPNPHAGSIPRRRRAVPKLVMPNL